MERWGLSSLARSSNHTHETDQIDEINQRDQPSQIPATRREMIPGACVSHVPYDEGLMLLQPLRRCIGKALGLFLSEICQEHQDVAHRNHADQFSILSHAEMPDMCMGHQIAGI